MTVTNVHIMHVGYDVIILLLLPPSHCLCHEGFAVATSESHPALQLSGELLLHRV